MVYKIQTPQPPSPQPPQSNQEVERLEELNKQLLERDYINNLSDDKIFRLELLNAMNRISLMLGTLTEKVVELAGGNAGGQQQ